MNPGRTRRPRPLVWPGVLAALLTWTSSGSASPPAQGDLLQAAFARELSSPPAKGDRSVIILDIATGRQLAALNASPLYLQAASIGSLVKPLTALAFLREGQETPRYTCPATQPGASGMPDCWYHPGHGDIGLGEALAYSCNHYFWRLSHTVPWDRFLDVLAALNLRTAVGDAPAASIPSSVRLEYMTGRRGRLRAIPVDVALAFAALFNGGKLYASRGERLHAALLGTRLAGWNTQAVTGGMADSVRFGTGRLAALDGVDLYAKTGTTEIPEAHSGEGAARGESEGWCIVVAPALHPPVLVLARVRPGRGAGEAAPLAGRALRVYLGLAALGHW